MPSWRRWSTALDPGVRSAARSLIIEHNTPCTPKHQSMLDTSWHKERVAGQPGLGTGGTMLSPSATLMWVGGHCHGLPCLGPSQT